MKKRRLNDSSLDAALIVLIATLLRLLTVKTPQLP